MDTLEHLLDQRRRASRQGDQHLVAELNLSLERIGYFDTAVTEAPLEQAIPVKRGPGRPRKNPLPPPNAA